MNIYINSEKSPAAVQAKATGSPVSSLRLKRGANLNLSVVVMGSTTACNLRFGIKAKGDYEGSLLAYAEAATGQSTEEGMKFDLCLSVASVALNEAFDVAIEALKRLTPQKPNLEGDGYADGVLVYDTWICPNCEKRYEVDYDEYDHCPDCGQAIDWSEEE